MEIHVECAQREVVVVELDIAIDGGSALRAFGVRGGGWLGPGILIHMSNVGAALAQTGWLGIMIRGQQSESATANLGICTVEHGLPIPKIGEPL